MTEKDMQEIYDTSPSRARDLAVRRTRFISMEEARLLYSQAKAFKPDNIFESGTGNGWSALWFSMCNVPVYTFDPIDRVKLWEDIDVSNIVYIEDKFNTIVDRYDDLKQDRNLFFIDGLHTGVGIQEDIKALQRFGKRGDVAFFHDLQEDPVRKAVGILAAKSTSYEIFNNPFPHLSRSPGGIDYRPTGKVVL